MCSRSEASTVCIYSTILDLSQIESILCGVIVFQETQTSDGEDFRKFMEL